MQSRYVIVKIKPADLKLKGITFTTPTVQDRIP